MFQFAWCGPGSIALDIVHPEEADATARFKAGRMPQAVLSTKLPGPKRATQNNQHTYLIKFSRATRVKLNTCEIKQKTSQSLFTNGSLIQNNLSRSGFTACVTGHNPSHWKPDKARSLTRRTMPKLSSPR